MIYFFAALNIISLALMALSAIVVHNHKDNEVHVLGSLIATSTFVIVSTILLTSI